MALHGEIKVNNREIGRWSATRTSKEINRVNTYACEVVTAKGKVTFTTDHEHGEGALALTIKVLAHAQQYV